MQSNNNSHNQKNLYNPSPRMIDYMNRYNLSHNMLPKCPFVPGDRVKYITPKGNVWHGIFIEMEDIGDCVCTYDPPVLFDNKDYVPTTFRVMIYELEKVT